MSVNGTDPPPGAAGGLVVRGRAEGERQAMPMRVLARDPAGGTLARCAAADGSLQTVECALVGPLEPRAIVLVLGGVALAQLDDEWA